MAVTEAIFQSFKKYVYIPASWGFVLLFVALSIFVFCCRKRVCEIRNGEISSHYLVEAWYLENEMFSTIGKISGLLSVLPFYFIASAR